jgi:hypothetical protein
MLTRLAVFGRVFSGLRSQMLLALQGNEGLTTRDHWDTKFAGSHLLAESLAHGHFARCAEALVFYVIAKRENGISMHCSGRDVK